MKLLPWGGTGQPDVIEIDEELAAELDEATKEYGELLSVIPYRQNVDYGRNRSFLKAVNRQKRGGRLKLKNESMPFSLEMFYDRNDETLHFRYAPGSDRHRRKLERQLRAFYKDSDIEMVPPRFLGASPGQYVSCARLKLSNDQYLRPLNNYKQDPEGFEQDPYDSIVNEMVGDLQGQIDANTMVQMTLKPALANVRPRRLNWYHGCEKVAKRIKKGGMKIRWGAVADGLASTFSDQIDQTQVETSKERDPYPEDRKAAGVVANQQNEKGYHLNIRIMAVADTPELARERVEDTAEEYQTFYNSTHGQGFLPVYPSGKEMRELLVSAARREFADRGIIQGLDSCAGVCHPPSNLTSPAAQYVHRRADDGVPPHAPSFEDYDGGGASGSSEPEADTSDDTATAGNRSPSFDQFSGGGD